MARSRPATSKRTARDVSPVKLAADELGFLRSVLNETLRQYRARLEGDIEHLRQVVLAERAGKKPALGNVRAARDMITLIRTLEVRPEKGRRRDLKKIEQLVEELQQVVAGG